MIKNLVIIVVIGAAICVPIVVITQKALMPNQSELERLDSLVKQTASPSSTVRRLAAPDRIDKHGATKTGFFMYVISGPEGTRQVRADWRIDRGQVELISVKVP